MDNDVFKNQDNKRLPMFILNLKKAFPIILLAILVLLMLCGAFFKINVFSNPEEIGTALGETNGKIVGKAIGSYEGITKGYHEGYSNGKEAGLSAVDTPTQIQSQIKSLGTGKLDVLSVSVRLSDFQTIGKDGKEDYASLYVIKGKVVYSVDLDQIRLDYGDNNELTVIFPKPEPHITNMEEMEKIFEIQKFSFSGSSKDGATALVNSLNNISSAADKEFANYDDLMLQAIESAKDQIKNLASAVMLKEKNITVICETEVKTTE